MVGGVFGAGKLFHKVEVSEKKIEEVEKQTEKTKEELTEKSILDMKQTILIEQTIKTLEKLNEKIDRGE